MLPHFLATTRLVTALLLAVCGLRAEALPATAVRGSVSDESGAVISGASIVLRTPAGITVALTTTDANGKYEMVGVPHGRYVLRAWQSGLAEAILPVDATGEAAAEIQIILRVRELTSTVTVTAGRGQPEDVATAVHAIRLLSTEQRLARPALILPQALREEPGVQIQQTSAHQGAVLIRGLTGQQVLHLVDGVRFNNSTFRPGPNQYLATVDPTFSEWLEISRGPNSMQYGSDSLGGTLNLLPYQPLVSSGTEQFHGELAPFLRTADLAVGSSVRFSYGSKDVHVLGGGSYRRAQDLRPGGGIDTHSAVTRFLGLPSRILGNRLQDTGFTQWAGYARFFWKALADQTVSATYHRGEQRGGRRYDQLNGGNGNLLNSFDPQVLDFFYARYEKQNFGWLDSLQGTFSFNRQRDDRQSQGGSGNPLAAITAERNHTSVFGYQGQGTTHLGKAQALFFGGEIYDEYIASTARTAQPPTNVPTVVRGRFPDGSRYTSFGLFAQHSADYFAARLRTQTGVRYSRMKYRSISAGNPLLNGLPTVPDFTSALADVTFQGGASYRIVPWLTAFASVARGFRAPNVNDFGSVGLTSNGFEVSPDEASSVRGVIGSSAGATAISTGIAAQQLSPETLWDYEGGLRWLTGRFTGSLSGFHYTVQDFITRRTLLLPAGALGTVIGGAPITQQLASGAVITAADVRPVITRANVGKIRLRGFEADVRVKVAAAVSVAGNLSYLHGRDAATGGAPDVEGGLPPLHGQFSVRWQPARRAYWFEAVTLWSDAQERLSSIELADQRIGAARSRAAIAAFFNSGAVARGLVQGGRLLPTGETLAQVQDRVLGAAAGNVPLFNSTSGFATFHLRGGYRWRESSEIIWVLENLLDKNYRLHGSGIDSPGRNLQITYVFRF
jgi:iron complex outermembrane receptor protein/hemoglobin/transferrin/lactoferrin receptor protein